MSFTLVIIAITVLISYSAFNNESIYTKLILWPRRMDSPREYYRLLTSGFIHADWEHLFFNMFTLFFFGRNAELNLNSGLFLLLYLSGIVVSSLPSFIKNRNNSYYRALGASGGVAAVLFSSVYFDPWGKIGIFFIPVWGIVAAIAYLAYSVYMSRKGRDAINHDAHFWGAVYGFLFSLAFDPTHKVFFNEVVHLPF
jgi:membrane associated rhomboid family serine protease